MTRIVETRPRSEPRALPIGNTTEDLEPSRAAESTGRRKLSVTEKAGPCKDAPLPERASEQPRTRCVVATCAARRCAREWSRQGRGVLSGSESVPTVGPTGGHETIKSELGEESENVRIKGALRAESERCGKRASVVRKEEADCVSARSDNGMVTNDNGSTVGNDG